MTTEEVSVSDVILADGNRLMLETVVLMMSLHEQEFFSKVGTLICENKGALTERDFSQVYIDNKVFEYIRRYWQVFGSTTPRPGHLLVFPQLASHLVETGAWLEDDVEEIRARVTWLVLKPKENYQPYLQKGPQIVSKWLEAVRTKKLIEKAANNLITPAELADEMASLRGRLSEPHDDSRWHKFGDGLAKVHPDVKRIPTPWAKVNAIVGGFGVGESDIWVAPSGAGKTVIATQCASVAALLGHKVLFVTTEQEYHELEPRIVSQHTGIPFSKIVDGLKTMQDTCTAAEQEKAHDIINRVGMNLEFHQWKPGAALKQELPAIIKQFQDRHGRLDMLVYDWIGKGLGESESNNPSTLRMQYRRAATALAEQAREFDIHVQTFAQANEALSTNKHQITAAMISEHKQLHEEMTRGFGVSCVRSGIHGTPHTQQALTIFKSRKSEGKSLLFYRDFEYQRFVDTKQELSRE